MSFVCRTKKKYSLTVSGTETIVWKKSYPMHGEAEKWEIKAIIEEKLVPVFGPHKTVMGILKEGSYKKWKRKLIK